MIQPQTTVKITDNSGAKIGVVFKVLGGSKRRYARIGDVVVLSVKSAEPRKLVKKKEVVRGIVVRQKQPFRRKDGSYIRFDENAVVLVEKEKKEPRAGRIFGPIPREIAEAG
ncbi:50S ribosomal protein L14, partial [candidate division KSB1 bacterium]